MDNRILCRQSYLDYQVLFFVVYSCLVLLTAYCWPKNCLHNKDRHIILMLVYSWRLLLYPPPITDTSGDLCLHDNKDSPLRLDKQTRFCVTEKLRLHWLLEMSRGNCLWKVLPKCQYFYIPHTVVAQKTLNLHRIMLCVECIFCSLEEY